MIYREVDRDVMHKYLVDAGWKVRLPGQKIVSRYYIDPVTGEKYGMGCTDFCYEIAKKQAENYIRKIAAPKPRRNTK